MLYSVQLHNHVMLPPRISLPCRCAVLTALFVAPMMLWSRPQPTQRETTAHDRGEGRKAWAPVTPFIPDEPISNKFALPYDPNGWTRLIDFPSADPFIKNLAGLKIDELDTFLSVGGNYPCKAYRDATLQYGMNGAAERFFAQDTHPIGNAFARILIGAPRIETAHLSLSSFETASRLSPPASCRYRLRRGHVLSCGPHSLAGWHTSVREAPTVAVRLPTRGAGDVPRACHEAREA